MCPSSLPPSDRPTTSEPRDSPRWPRRHAGSRETSVWIVDIDPGAPGLPHALTREEVFVVLEGTASVTVAGQRGDAEPGDAFVVPPHELFHVVNEGAGTLRMVCCLPVGGQARAEGAPFTPPWAE